MRVRRFGAAGWEGAAQKGKPVGPPGLSAFPAAVQGSGCAREVGPATCLLFSSHTRFADPDGKKSKHGSLADLHGSSRGPLGGYCAG